jgi:DNA-binding NarL/FixJ family response regulator
MTEQNTKIRILVVDDHPFFRTGIIQWLNQQKELTCCGEAGSIAQARKAIAELKPQVVLLDLHLPDGDGLDLCSELSQSAPETRILCLTHRDENTFAHRALRAGARGYIMKSEATDTWLLARSITSSPIPFPPRPILPNSQTENFKFFN